MKEYETVYIANPNLTDAQFQQLNDRVKAMVEKDKGTFFYARNMGKRKLAYLIEKQSKGNYFCLDYTSPGDTVAEIERMFRLNENVMRFLTVVKADRVDVEARRAEIAARGEDASAAVAEEASTASSTSSDTEKKAAEKTGEGGKEKATTPEPAEQKVKEEKTADQSTAAEKE